MSTLSSFGRLAGQPATPGLPAPSASELARLLAQLVVLLEGGKSLDALKKPGAWQDVPLQTSTPDAPIWYKLPGAIEFVNVPAAALGGQLTAVPDARGNSSKIKVVPLLQT